MGNIKHGDTARGKTQRLYRIWSGMISRCTNENVDSYKYYGAKGISVCEEWKDYVKFKQWAESNGYNDNLTIDRINNDKEYCPENCRWITIKEQERNRSNNHIVEYNGESHTISEWSEIFNINVDDLIYRIKSGWDIQTALTKPINEYNKKIEYNGESHTYKEWAEIMDIPYSTLMCRINTCNMSIEAALCKTIGYTELDDKIIKCRVDHPSWSQAKIARELNCSTAKVCKTLKQH